MRGNKLIVTPPLLTIRGVLEAGALPPGSTLPPVLVVAGTIPRRVWGRGPPPRRWHARGVRGATHVVVGRGGLPPSLDRTGGDVQRVAGADRVAVGVGMGLVGDLRGVSGGNDAGQRGCCGLVGLFRVRLDNLFRAGVLARHGVPTVFEVTWEDLCLLCGVGREGGLTAREN